MARGFLTVAFALALTGCDSGGDSSVDVVVSETSPGLSERPDELALTVTRLGGGELDEIVRSAAVVPREAADGLIVPWVVRVRPRSPDDAGSALYRFRVAASRASRSLVTVQSRMVFVPRTNVVLAMHLEPRCEAVSCAADQTCRGGSCTDDAFEPDAGADADAVEPDASGRCASPRIACGAICTDVGTDELNCGACGETCLPPRTCTGGACVCGPGRATCPSGCANLSVDRSNCGACGFACDGGSVCLFGICGP